MRSRWTSRRGPWTCCFPGANTRLSTTSSRRGARRSRSTAGGSDLRTSTLKYAEAHYIGLMAESFIKTFEEDLALIPPSASNSGSDRDRVMKQLAHAYLRLWTRLPLQSGQRRTLPPS